MKFPHPVLLVLAFTAVLAASAAADLKLNAGTKIIFPDGTTLSSAKSEFHDPFSSIRSANFPLTAPFAFPINNGPVPAGMQLVILHVRGAGMLLLQSRPPAPDQDSEVTNLAVISGAVEDFPDGTVVIEAGRQPWIATLQPYVVEGTRVISIHGYLRANDGSDATARIPFSAVRNGMNLEQSTPIEFPEGPVGVPTGKELVILRINGGFESGLGYMTFTPSPQFAGGWLQSRKPIPNDLQNPIDLLYISPDEARGDYRVEFPDLAVVIPAGRQPWIDYTNSPDRVDFPFAFSIHGYIRDAAP